MSNPDNWIGIAYLVVFVGWAIGLALAVTDHPKALAATGIVVLLLLGGSFYGWAVAARANCDRLGFGPVLEDCREYTVIIPTRPERPAR